MEEEVVLGGSLVGERRQVVLEALGQGRRPQNLLHHADHTAALLVGEHAKLSVNIIPADVIRITELDEDDLSVTGSVMAQWTLVSSSACITLWVSLTYILREVAAEEDPGLTWTRRATRDR